MMKNKIFIVLGFYSIFWAGFNTALCLIDMPYGIFWRRVARADFIGVSIALFCAFFCSIFVTIQIIKYKQGDKKCREKQKYLNLQTTRKQN